MRYPEGHKEETRARIVAAAAQALRRSGIAGVSIPALMKRAGLTHGGFYGHFRDRDDLVAAAVRSAGMETAGRVFGASTSLDAALDAYLSPGHAAHPALGCVVAALGSEGRHQRGEVRAAFADVARGLIDLVDAKLRPGAPRPEPSDASLALTATMVGAVVLARLVDDPALAGRILAAARGQAPASAD